MPTKSTLRLLSWLLLFVLPLLAVVVFAVGTLPNLVIAVLLVGGPVGFATCRLLTRWAPDRRAPGASPAAG